MINHIKQYGIIAVALLVALTIFAALAVSSLNSARSSVGGVAMDMAIEESYGDGDDYERAYMQKSTAATYDEAVENEVTIDRQIIKTGSLDLIVGSVEDASRAVADIADAYDGIVVDRNIYESQGDKKRGNIYIKVPNDRFENAFDDIKDVAIKVSRESANTEDVTEQYIDLQAQLKNKQAVEEQYLAVLERAWQIEDILSVQERLDRTRGEIERLQGRITYLERQVSMSSISVSLVSESEAAVLGVVWNPLTQIKQAAYDTLESLIGFLYMLIQLVFMIPVILLWVGLVGGVAYVVYRITLFVRKKLAYTK